MLFPSGHICCAGNTAVTKILLFHCQLRRKDISSLSKVCRVTNVRLPGDQVKSITWARWVDVEKFKLAFEMVTSVSWRNQIWNYHFHIFCLAMTSSILGLSDSIRNKQILSSVRKEKGVKKLWNKGVTYLGFFSDFWRKLSIADRESYCPGFTRSR